MQAQRRALYATQADSIRKRAMLVDESARLKAAAEAAGMAQGEAAVREDYERAAQLASQIEQIQMQERACMKSMEEAAKAYEAAEAQKGKFDVEEVTVYQSHAEECKRCLNAREEKARREAATVASSLAAEASVLAAEGSRIEGEEATFAAKDRELVSKLEEANAAIGEETRDSQSERLQWQQKSVTLDGEVQALKQQLEMKMAEVSQCAAQVQRCDQAIQAVHTKYGKSIKRLQQKQETLQVSKGECAKARAEYERSKLRHESEVAQGESAQARRDAWIADAAQATKSAGDKIEQHKAASALAVRVTQAAAALQGHKSTELTQLKGLRDELSSNQASQQRHATRVLEVQTEAELLARQLNAAEEQRVRLELEKKLAASSQKFADAARLSAELKALTAKLEGAKANQAAMLASVDGERASQAAEAQREGELQSELQSEQRELDEVKFQLLREQARALELLMPQAEAAHSELLRYELESSVSQLSELQSRWGWDETGKAPVAATMDLLGGGGGGAAAAAAVEESDDEDDSEEASSDEEAAAPAPPAANPFGFMATTAPAPAMPPAAALPPPTQQPAATAAGEESSDEESEEEDNSHMADAPSWLTSAASEVLGDPKPPIAPPPAALPPPAPPQPAQEESSEEEEEDSGDASPTPVPPPPQPVPVAAPAPAPAAPAPAPAPPPPPDVSDSGGLSELDQLKKEKEELEDRMQVEVDNDNFDEATRLQEMIDELSDKIDALE